MRWDDQGWLGPITTLVIAPGMCRLDLLQNTYQLCFRVQPTSARISSGDKTSTWKHAFGRRAVLRNCVLHTATPREPGPSVTGIHPGCRPGAATPHRRPKHRDRPGGMGRTEVREIAQRVRAEFPAGECHITSKNCNHFSDAFCKALFGKSTRMCSLVCRTLWRRRGTSACASDN